ncbi:nucleotidyltransferase substrate binding protein [Synechococcus sp. AH-707-B22]|nr:nucleotidyltransferase substrate binding protein [Synechococcus sp. AH-707-B22]
MSSCNKWRLVLDKRALEQLDALLTAELNGREHEGLLKAFEFNFELAWHTLDAFAACPRCLALGL